jgi:hypothetical protein
VFRVSAVGRTDREEWLETLRAIRQHPEFTAQAPLLVDVRAMESLPAPGRARNIADDLQLLLAHGSIAIVANEGTALYGVMRQVCAMSRDQAVTFATPDEALDWLTKTK